MYKEPRNLNTLYNSAIVFVMQVMIVMMLLVVVLHSLLATGFMVGILTRLCNKLLCVSGVWSAQFICGRVFHYFLLITMVCKSTFNECLLVISSLGNTKVHKTQPLLSYVEVFS